jgi:hypothetical protein
MTAVDTPVAGLATSSLSDAIYFTFSSESWSG